MLCVVGVLPVLIDTGVDDSWCWRVGGRCSALFFFLRFSNAVVIADCFVRTLIDSTVCILLNRVLSTTKTRQYGMLVYVWNGECRASVRTRTGNEEMCETIDM